MLRGRGRSAGGRVVVAAVLTAAALAGCATQTKAPSSVATTAATLNGVLSCSADVDGRWAWQWRELGTRAWTSGGGVQVDCPHRVMPLSYRATGLKPDTTYEYRMLVDVGRRCDLNAPSTCRDVASIDGAGRLNGTSWSTMTTQPRCDDVQAAGESLAHFVDSADAGTPAARKVLCLRGGTQDIGQVNGIPAWATLTPQGESNGTKQTSVLIGNIALDHPGAALEDVRVKGCYGSAGCSGSRDKVVDVTANDTALIHLDLTQRNDRSDRIQCVHVGSDHGQLTGVRMEYSKSHACGPQSDDHHYHGLYCRDAIGMRVTGNWFYDNEGFGVQMYPNCDGAVAMGNVIAMNGGSCDLSGTGSSTQTSGAVYRNGFCGLARDSELFPPVHCYNAGSNQVVDMVVYDTLQPRGVTDCGSGQLKQSGTYNANPQFVDPGRRDFRMRNPFARAKLGIYAEIVPGPRW